MDLCERVVAATTGVGCPEPVLVDWFSLHLQVHTDDAATREYVASQHHTLESSVACTPQVVAHADLHAVADSKLLARIRNSADGPVHSRREAFRGEWYTLRRLPSEEYVLLTEEGHASPHALATSDFRSFVLVAQSPAGVRLVISRTVRELVRESLLAQGALMFHGAAAQGDDGSGALFVGQSSSGKTSSAIWMARDDGGRVVGTDRVMLVRDKEQWIVVGLPMSTRLGAGAVRALGVESALRERVPIRSINPFQREAAKVPAEAVTQVGLDKVWLSNGEVYELLGCGFAAATTADDFIILENASVAAPLVEQLSPREAAVELAKHLMAPDPDFRSLWLAEEPKLEPSGATARNMFDQLLRERVVTRIAWNPTRHCGQRVSELFRIASAR
ncbi:hypothetical protein ACWEPC_58415 [Nonomuraea sp. NPDC004297]